MVQLALSPPPFVLMRPQVCDEPCQAARMPVPGAVPRAAVSGNLPLREWASSQPAGSATHLLLGWCAVLLHSTCGACLHAACCWLGVHAAGGLGGHEQSGVQGGTVA